LKATLLFMGADIFSLIIFLAIFLFSVVIHEVSHGLMANYLGDSTAKDSGRLSLNPLVHLDIVGSLLVPGFLLLLSRFSGVGIIFGWAKPVPVNFNRLRDQKYGVAKVSLAGPAANLFLALFFGLLIRFVLSHWAGLNFVDNLTEVFGLIVWVNLLLAIFNLLPIPPLDGSHILLTFLPQAWKKYGMLLQRYSLILLLVFIFFFFDFLIPIIQFCFKFIVGHYFF